MGSSWLMIGWDRHVIAGIRECLALEFHQWIEWPCIQHSSRPTARLFLSTFSHAAGPRVRFRVTNDNGPGEMIDKFQVMEAAYTIALASDIQS
ncbi:unnamed protein product [Penicillium nalgiovense]|nr:unnamed protein product [Penicillium nalgiovense]